MNAQGHYADGPIAIDADAQARANLQGADAHAVAAAQAGPSDGDHVRIETGVSTDRAPYVEGSGQAGPVTVAATTDNGGSAHAAAHAVDDDYSVDMNGGVDQITTDPNGHFRVNVRASPVPGMNVGMSGGGENIGQPDAAGDMQAYARIPLGDRAAVTMDGGMAATPQGVTYQGGAAVTAQPSENVSIGANARVSDSDGDGTPDVVVQGGAQGTF